MFQKDYFMRYVEEASKVIARALGLEEQGELDKALEVVETAWTGLLELDIDAVKALPEDELIDYLSSELAFTPDKLEATADLLFWEGHFLLHAKRTQNAELSLRKARILLQHVIQQEGTFSMVRNNRIHELERLINKCAA